MASSSSSRPLGSISKEPDNLPHEQSEQLPTSKWDIFLSHSGAQKGFAKDLFKMLYPPYNVFFDVDRPSLPLGEPFPPLIFHAAKTCRVALVVLSNEFFCSKWPMLELSTFFDAGVQVLPLFYELSPQDLSSKEKCQEWDKKWEKFASKDSRIRVSSWADARHKLCSINGPIFKKFDGEMAYLDEIVSAIYKMIPPLFRSSHANVHGRARLCKVLIDKFEELERRPRDPYADLSRAYLLGVYGLPGSGKSTLCACLRDHFSSSFSGKALHLKLPTDPTPTELLGAAKRLLKLTDFGHNREKMMLEIEELSEMYGILEASNLQRSQVFLVIDNISSRESIDFVKHILGLGVGVGSRVMLVARTSEILDPLLKFPGKHDNQICFVCGEMRVPSVNEEEAICVLLQSAGGLDLASDDGQIMEEKYNPSHREIIAKVARMCAFHCKWSSDPFYLPLALKIIGAQLGSNGMDLETGGRQLLQLNPGMVEELKEGAVRKIVEESYEKLSERQKLLFLDVALFMTPYCLSDHYETEQLAVELLGFMHECRPETIKWELNELRRLCFLESGSRLDVHDVFLEFARSVPDASFRYYCRREKYSAGLQEVMLDLLMMAPKSTEGLRALILELDERCERFEFPPGLSSVMKVVVVRQCKSLEVLGLAGLTSLVSLEIEGCPRLRHLDFDPGLAYTLKRARWVRKSNMDVADQQQQGSFQKRLLQMLQAGSAMPAKRLINKVWCHMSALGGWSHRPPENGFMNLASQMKALQELRLEQTGITSLGDVSSCWPQLRVLEVFEGQLEELELGKLPKLKQFFYGDAGKVYFELDRMRSLYVTRKHGPKMLRKPNLLAGCPELEDVRFCEPAYEDGMGSLKWPPNLRILQLADISHVEPVLLEFSSSAHSLEKIFVTHHRALQSVVFTCQFLNLVHIQLNECDNLVSITGLEWLPMLSYLDVWDCAKLQSIGTLRMSETLELIGCPVQMNSLPGLSSQHLHYFTVLRCPNAEFSARDLENLTALRTLTCNMSGNRLKLKNLVRIERMQLRQEREGQVNDCPLSACSYDEEANCEQVNGNIAQGQGMKYVPLLVVGELAAPHLSSLTLRGVQNLVSLGGIHWLCTLARLTLENLPDLTCFQGLESLINLEYLTISHCPGVRELPSLCSLVKLGQLTIYDCVNLSRLEGLHNMSSLEYAVFSGCQNLELCPEMLKQMTPRGIISFRQCKFASIQAMVGWVLDETVSKAMWYASFDALIWELTNHLLEKPRERRELAEQLVETLGLYFTKNPPALLTHGENDCFDLIQPWLDALKKGWSCVCRWRKEVPSFPRGLVELLEKVGRVPLKEVLQQCQSDAHFRASAANCLMEEQKGFIKGRFILDAIISMWEGMELINDNELDMLFFKIDFDKAYDRVEWEFILQSLQDMGFGKTFIKYVHCLFGNARTFVALNGKLSPAISLKRSIRQGCPLAPLLFVIVADALGWLVQGAINSGHIRGLSVPGAQKDLCLQQFADDTNSFVHNDPESVSWFMQCLNIFCSASGSVINHGKTGVWSSTENVPELVSQAGCQTIPSGTIFRLLGIPMGFGVTLKERWLWVVNKFKGKLARWKGYQPNLASRLFVLNHFILPSVIYYLSCWRPPQSHIKMLNPLINNFLWGGDETNRKIVKVALKTCMLPKAYGGLGLMDINLMASKLAAKWIIRSMGNMDFWALLLHRHCGKFQLKALKAWSGFTSWEVFLSKFKFIYKGSPLVKGLWTSWDLYRDQLCISSNSKAMAFLLGKESMWIGLTNSDVSREVLLKAHKLWKAGITTWSQLTVERRWDPSIIQGLPPSLQNLLRQKFDKVTSAGFPLPNDGQFCLQQVCFLEKGKNLLPLPTLYKEDPKLFSKLNAKWGIQWCSSQWIYRFKVIWSMSLSIKKSILLWLIAHQAVWTRERAAKIGKGDGICSRCKRDIEDIKHLFFECPFNQQYFNFLNHCFAQIKPLPLTAYEILMGECIHLDIMLWHNIRSTLLFCIWRERNSAVFSEKCTSHGFIFMTEVKHVVMQASRTIKEALQQDQTIQMLMQSKRWQSWQTLLSKYYSKEKLLMIEGIQDSLKLHNV